MARLVVTLPDGKGLEFEGPSSIATIAERIGKGLAKAAIGGKVDGTLVDLSHTVAVDASVEIVTGDHAQAHEFYRHTMTHIMAQAVKRLYPGTALAFGPVVEEPIPGFFYDMDIPAKISDEDLEKIGAEMSKIIDADFPIERFELSGPEASAKLASMQEPLKVEHVGDLVAKGESRVSFYRQGEFTDLCEGPHLPRTGAVKHFKLLSLAGAYWKGDNRNRQLTRIYGTAFFKKADLDALLTRIEESRKRDHRRLGKELDLFSFHDEAPGFPFFHPAGTTVYQTLVDWVRSVERRRGYQEIRTPQILDAVLWHRSGHWDNYRDNMYFLKVDDVDFAVKPMNCPAGCLVYGTRPHSYKELPVRLADFGTLHRHELSGVMHGLFRVRAFSQDDAHIFCLPDQIQAEVLGCLEMLAEMYKTLGFDTYRVELSTRPAKSVGADAIWESATGALQRALEASGLPFKVNPGDGAFYGPKIDFHVQDSIGRTWQCGTVQLDFNSPERFDLSYVGSDNQSHRPVMIHRALLGSFERFLGILIEHTAGRLPLWLAPVQVSVLTITDAQADYAREVHDWLAGEGIRAQVDVRPEKINFKIREAQVRKVPLMVVLGNQELEQRKISVRLRSGKNVSMIAREEFLEKVYRANLHRAEPE